MILLKIIKFTIHNCLQYLYNLLYNFYIRWYRYVNRNTIIKSSAKISNDSLIWSNCYIWDNVIITKTIIWNYCSIAPNVSIWLWEHDVFNISTSWFLDENSYDSFTKEDCIIWHDVRIGVGSIIRRWVRIWNWSIIWANSFVNKDVPPYAIVWGSPAKLIKYRFWDMKIKIIEESKRRNSDIKNAKLVIKNLNKTQSL